jgi:hypothetical protein
MKKLSLILLSLLIFVFLFAITLSVQAGPPEPAEGIWLYTPFILDEKVAGCNSILTTYEEGIWSGTFEGTSREDGTVKVHCKGNWNFKAIAYFEDVTVDGRSGTLTMTVNGTRPDALSDWFGHWTITDGTDELENLRGHGTFWGPGAPAPGEQGTIFYDGKYHFSPN